MALSKNRMATTAVVIAKPKVDVNFTWRDISGLKARLHRSGPCRFDKTIFQGSLSIVLHQGEPKHDEDVVGQSSPL